MIYSVGAKSTTPEHLRVYDRKTDLYSMKQTAIAFHGACQVQADADGFFGGKSSKPFVSKVLVNPTWRKLFGVAKRQQKKTRDGHHCFFEGYGDTGEDLEINGEKVRILYLYLGS